MNDFDRMDRINGMEFEVCRRVGVVRWSIGSLPITNRRYGRLQICVTVALKEYANPGGNSALEEVAETYLGALHHAGW